MGTPARFSSKSSRRPVLRERGKLDEALTTIKRAVQLQPGNKINEAILDQIRKDQGVPWYKRLFAD